MSEPQPEARKKCPLCGKPSEVRFRPFCSKHCADVDLARWLKGHYAIPAHEAPEGEEKQATEPGDEPDGREE